MSRPKKPIRYKNVEGGLEVLKDGEYISRLNHETIVELAFLKRSFGELVVLAFIRYLKENPDFEVLVKKWYSQLEPAPQAWKSRLNKHKRNFSERGESAPK